MLTPFLRRLAVLLVVLSVPALARAENPMIAKARAYLGPEEAINAIRTIHYVGSMTVTDAANPAKSITIAVDLVFEAPYRQRTLRTTDSIVDVIALDDYDGWHRVQEVKNPAHWRLQVQSAPEVKRQRATVWENVAFYRGLEHEGGKVLDQGTVDVGGIRCRKLAFVHSDDIIFYRFFDEATGRLVRSETEAGSVIREQGEIMAGGVRFPRIILNTLKDADGKEQSITITFDKVTVNETFPDSYFAIPPLNDK